MKKLSLTLFLLLITLSFIASVSCSKKPTYKKTPSGPRVEKREKPEKEPPKPREVVSENTKPKEVPALPEKQEPEETEPIPEPEPMPEEELMPEPTPETQPVYEGKILEDFENLSDWSFRGYPENVVIGAVDKNATHVKSGMFSGQLTYDFTGAANKSAAAYMKTNKMIPMGVNEITIWVYGNGSGHWLRARFIDAKGIKYVADLARELTWRNEWRKVTIRMSDIVGFDRDKENLPYELPLTLEYIYLYAAPNAYHDTGTIYFDQMIVK